MKYTKEIESRRIPRINELQTRLSTLKSRGAYLVNTFARLRGGTGIITGVFLEKKLNALSADINANQLEIADTEDLLDSLTRIGHPNHAMRIQEFEEEVKEYNELQREKFQKEREAKQATIVSSRIEKQRRKEEHQRRYDEIKRNRERYEEEQRQRRSNGRGRGRGRGSGRGGRSSTGRTRGTHTYTQ